MAIFNSKLLVYQRVPGGRGLKTLAERTSAGAKPRCWTSFAGRLRFLEETWLEGPAFTLHNYICIYIYIHTIIYLIFTDVFWKHSLWIICRIIFPVVVFPEVSGDVEATQEKARQRELEEERQQPLALQVETPLLSTFFRTDRSLTIDA